MIYIKGYENQYSILNDGQVYSHKNNCFLKQSIGTTGYCRVNLNNKDGGKTFKVHRLVAIYYIPTPKKYYCVNHKNGNKLDNRVENLEWCDYTHNNRHARKLGLCKNAKGLKSKRCKKVMRHDTGEIFEALFQAAESCGKFKSRSCLSNHLNGRTKSFDGTTWEFLK